MKLLIFVPFLTLFYSAESRSTNDTHHKGAEEFRPQKMFRGIQIQRGSKISLIAALRQYPSENHLCSASFIRRNALITTAYCIYGKVPGDYFIHTQSLHTDEGGIVVKVKNFYPHPYFDVSPTVNDIGVITLVENVENAFVQALPLAWQEHKGTVSYYFWAFHTETKDYIINERQAVLMSNSKCSRMLYEFIDCKHLCATAPNIHLGRGDHGTPLNGKIKEITYILAIFNRQGQDNYLGAEKFLMVYPYVEWIKSVLALDQSAPPNEPGF